MESYKFNDVSKAWFSSMSGIQFLTRNMRKWIQSQRLCMVVGLFLLTVMLVIMDLLCIGSGEGFKMAGINFTSKFPNSDDDAKVWETAPPLGIPLYRRNLQLYNSTGRKEEFEESLIARQEEMKQLMRNISASMSKNPLVQQIHASRAKFRYKPTTRLSIDPSLQQHKGYDAVWQPVNGTSHKFFVYSAFYDDREKHLVRVIATTKTKKSEKVNSYLLFWLFV